MTKASRKKILIISHDKIGSSMAGPGIRYHYMAETLADKFDVTIGFFGPDYLPEPDFKRSYNVSHIDAQMFAGGFQGVDIVIALWLSEAMLDYCNKHNIFVVFDMYVAGPVEVLASSLFNDKSAWSQDDFAFDQSLSMYRRFFENGDLFLYSNRRQLDYWIGYIFGADQIHLSSYPERPIYDRFIPAPMGIDTSLNIKHSKDVIRGIIPGINKNDKVLLWTGGIWGHFDGRVLIRAMKLLQKKNPDIKLFFFGTKHPNPSVIESNESVETFALATKLGLINKNVYLNDGWVDYHDRINYLLEADVAVNTHKSSVETEFSHRTRVLDHLLTELPTISTQGDYLSDEVIKYQHLGLTIPPNDEHALAAAIIEILEPKNHAQIKINIHAARKDYDWQQTMKPLKDFLLNNPSKLTHLQTTPKLKSSNPALRLAKKSVPKPIKKVIVRTLKSRR